MTITLYVSVSLAFQRSSGVSGPIVTVVINRVLITNPTKAPPLVGIEVLEFLLIPPTLALRVTKFGLHRGLTTIDVEALV